MPDSPQSSQIKTRILILSDTHTASLYPADQKDVPFREPLPQADVVLHCGDLTMVGKLWEFERALDLLRKAPAELKLVIAGNHDISLDEDFYARKGQQMQRLRAADPTLPSRAKQMWTGAAAREAGVVYLEEGFHTFTLQNGARLRVYASPYQPEFCDWAFPYWRNQDRYNPSHLCSPGAEPIAQNPVPDFPEVDVMMTHGPPMGIRDEVGSGEHVGCEHLLRAARRCRPKIHCFGHIHEGWGAERVRWTEGGNLDVAWEKQIEGREWIEPNTMSMEEEGVTYIDISDSGQSALTWGKETLMVNASVMTQQYRPIQSPWLVDVDLDRP